jgi:hypothetical protein
MFQNPNEGISNHLKEDSDCDEKLASLEQKRAGISNRRIGEFRSLEMKAKRTIIPSGENRALCRSLGRLLLAAQLSANK